MHGRGDADPHAPVAARPPWLRRRLLELGAILAAIVAIGWTSYSPCLRESNYYCIRVVDNSLVGSRPGQYRGLYLDHLLHGVVDLDDPSYLYYGYERLYARAIEKLHPRGANVDAFFAGGGSYTFPGWVERRTTADASSWPRSIRR